jgi:hypothetical protein
MKRWKMKRWKMKRERERERERERVFERRDCSEITYLEQK